VESTLPNWNQIEKKAIRDFGGRPTPASGARPGNKADGRLGAENRITGSWRIDVKSTGANSFRATPKILDKLSKDSNHTCDNPMLLVNFINERRKVCIVPIEFIDDESELTLGPNLIEPYDDELWFKSRNGTTYAVLSETSAKIRLRLEDL
jgi:hypothetical protein